MCAKIFTSASIPSPCAFRRCASGPKTSRFCATTSSIAFASATSAASARSRLRPTIWLTYLRWLERYLAACALESIGPGATQALPALQRTLDDPDPIVREAAAPYLWPTQREGLSVVAASLGDLSQAIGAALVALYSSRSVPLGA